MASTKSLVAGLGLTALLIGACLNDTELRFGPPGELRRPTGNASGDGCPIPPESASPTTCPTWSDVLQLLSDSYGCADANCHGPGATFPPLMDPADPDGTYDTLKEYKTEDGRPYVSDNAADRPWMLCNLSDNPDVKIGALMPLGNNALVAGADLITIGQWVDCGMQKTGGTAGTGGSTSSSGAGGSGGAGGN